MTTIVAVKSGGRIAMAADRRIVWDMDTDPSAVCTKLFRLPGGGAIGFCGHDVFHQLFVTYAGTRTDDLRKLSNQAAIFELFVDFWRWARASGTIVKDMPDGCGHVSAQINASFLVAVPAGIFSVGGDLAVTEHGGGYWAVGSGCDYALGALRSEWFDAGYTAEGLCRHAIEVAAHFSLGTGASIEVDDWAAE